MLERAAPTDSAVIQCPTVLLWGDRVDIFGMADQHELLRRISGARLYIFSDAGHALHWEAPGDFVRRLTPALQH
jgi:pimeloyl-ACP methyl ester carboxylesterase